MKILLILLSLIFATSCTLEKRLYSNGYHVEWNIKKKGPNESVAQKKTHETEIERANQVSKLDQISVSSLSYSSDEGNKMVVQTFKEGHEVIKRNSPKKLPTAMGYLKPSPVKDAVKSQQIDNQRIPINKLQEEPIQKSKREGLAITSLVLGLCGLSVLAIIFGLVQLKRVNANPDIFGGVKMARAGVMLGCLFIFLSSTFLAIFFGSAFVYMMLALSLTAFVIGMYQLISYEGKKIKDFGLFLAIFGWLGVILTTLLVFG